MKLVKVKRKQKVYLLREEVETQFLGKWSQNSKIYSAKPYIKPAQTGALGFLEKSQRTILKPFTKAKFLNLQLKNLHKHTYWGRYGARPD